MTSRHYWPIKRAIDVCIVTPVFVLSLPIQLAIAVAIRRTMGSPVLFRQERPGRYGAKFTMTKFRTMADGDADPSTDCDRITPFGAWLRSTSLDELPTLYNILRGDMSLVGPRPLLPQYVARYSSKQARRLDVRPGLTGLAQVNGRNALSWEQRFELDVYYVEGASLALDFTILLKTVLTVLRREGITADGSATMPEFMGSGGR